MAAESADLLPKRKAEDCPWYLLATLYGVAGSRDKELQAKNRMAWNRFMATGLSANIRAELTNEGRHSKEELTAFVPAEVAVLEIAFANRRGPASSVPFPQGSEIDFSNLEFEVPFQAQGFLFAGSAHFCGANFSDEAAFDDASFLDFTVFDDATFSGYVRFNGAGFFHYAGFKRATFADEAAFEGATFSGDGGFERASFLDDAGFERTTFFHSARFDGATFSGDASFDCATVHGEIRFINSEMKSETSFEAVTFKVSPPLFFGAKLHEGTVWYRVKWPPCPLDPDVAAKFVNAYERLKLEMDRLKKHEDELDFFALEMQSRWVLYRDWLMVSEATLFGTAIRLPVRVPRPSAGLPIALYGILCNYGRSYVRPICGLLVTVATGAVLLWPHFGFSKFDKAIGLSLANTFGVLGFRKDFVSPEAIRELSDFLAVIAGLQTVAGAILLFFLGLALRNRFRMR